MPKEIGYAFYGEDLFIGCRDSLGIVLDGLKSPKEKSLAANPVFAKAAIIGAEGAVFGFVHFAKLVDLAKSRIPEPRIVDFIDALGLFDIQSISTSWSSSGSYSTSRTILHVRGMDKGFFKTLSPADEGKLSALIPEDVAECSVHNIHLENILAVIDKAVSTHLPDKIPFWRWV